MTAGNRIGVTSRSPPILGHNHRRPPVAQPGATDAAAIRASTGTPTSSPSPRIARASCGSHNASPHDHRLESGWRSPCGRTPSNNIRSHRIPQASRSPRIPRHKLKPQLKTLGARPFRPAMFSTVGWTISPRESALWSSETSAPYSPFSSSLIGTRGTQPLYESAGRDRSPCTSCCSIRSINCLRPRK